MRMHKQDLEKLTELYESTIASTEGNTGKTNAYTDFLRVMEERGVNSPLIEEDGTEVEGTVYLGDGYYLSNASANKHFQPYKAESGIYLCKVNPTHRSTSDGSMPWSGYMRYDRTLNVTPELLQAAASAARRL